MNRLRSRSRTSSAHALLHQLVDRVDVDDLRDRASKAAGSASASARSAAQRGRSAAHDAPSPSELASQARDSRVVEAVLAGASAVLPIVTSAASDALQRKSVRRAMRHAPALVAKRSLASRALVGMGSVGAALGAAFVAHRAWKTWQVRKQLAERDVRVTGNQYDALERMDDEGPTPGAYDGEPASLTGSISDGGSTRLRS